MARDGVSIDNCADVSSAATDPDFANNPACTMHEITEVANLGVTKSAVGQVGGCGDVVDVDDAVTPNDVIIIKNRYKVNEIVYVELSNNVFLAERLQPVLHQQRLGQQILKIKGPVQAFQAVGKGSRMAHGDHHLAHHRPGAPPRRVANGDRTHLRGAGAAHRAGHQ